jgi:all-trans-retinol dehydrogenase (NAD+)
VDILINNAGIVSGKKILDITERDLKKTFDVNAISHVFTVKEFLPEMLKQDKGHIVSIVSVAGIIGVPGLSDYCGSKFAAFGIDESLRLELKNLKSNVTTTCVCPYFINTGMFEGVKTDFPLLPMLD